MKLHKDIIIENSFQKAEEAFKTAEFNIQNNFLDAAQNRIYYAIFYVVMALGYNEDFTTSKHRQLLGWFNKNFIKDKKIFSVEMNKFYQKAYENRMKSDYEFIWKPNKADLVADLKDAKQFIEVVKKYINHE